jgi:hypothetical protein
LGVDHFGKVVETGTKGSTSKEDNADTLLVCLGERDMAGTVTNPRVAVRKAKGGEAGREYPFTVKQVETGGKDFRGRPNTTLVIEWGEQIEKPAVTSKATGWSKTTNLLRQVLMRMLVDAGEDIRPWSDGPMVRAVKYELVRAEFYKSSPPDGDPKQRAENRKKALMRAAEQAHDRDLVGIREIEGVSWIWLTKLAEKGQERDNLAD